MKKMLQFSSFFIFLPGLSVTIRCGRKSRAAPNVQARFA